MAVPQALLRAHRVLVCQGPLVPVTSGSTWKATHTRSPTLLAAPHPGLPRSFQAQPPSTAGGPNESSTEGPLVRGHIEDRQNGGHQAIRPQTCLSYVHDYANGLLQPDQHTSSRMPTTPEVPTVKRGNKLYATKANTCTRAHTGHQGIL